MSAKTTARIALAARLRGAAFAGAAGLVVIASFAICASRRSLRIPALAGEARSAVLPAGGVRRSQPAPFASRARAAQ
jgi:hypothetical protein